MELTLFGRKFKISVFSLVIFAFFLLVSLVSLHVVRERILENSRIMGQEIAARFATRETGKIKGQEILLRSVASNMGRLLELKPSWSDEEIRQAMQHFTEYMEKTTDTGSFDLSSVIDGRFIVSRRDAPDDYSVRHKNNSNLRDLKPRWYQAALDRNGDVAYTNLYERGASRARVLTMAVAMGHNEDVLAIHLYPQQINTIFEDNRLPRDSYYYLCDPNGMIMFAVSGRDMSIEEQQPYVDHILKQIYDKTRKDKSYIIDYEGNKRGLYYTISDKGWISLVTIPYDYIIGDYQNLMNWFLLMLVLFLIIVVMLALRENVLNKEIGSVNQVVQVMSKSFLAVYRIDFISGSYQLMKADKVDFAPQPTGNYRDLLKKILTYVEPEAVAEFAATFSLENIRALAARNITDYGGEFRQRFGRQYKWVNVRLLRDDLLKKSEAILFFREVEGEKQKELERMELTERALRAAKETSQSRNMFFSAMSHDMRAPLNGIIGMAELAEIHKDESLQVSSYLRKIKASGQQLLTLINDILEMARLDNGKVEHLQEAFSLRHASEDIAGVFAGQAELEDKFFYPQINLEDELVIGDLCSLNQILNNVLSNALKYTQPKGSITFTVRRENLHEEKHDHYTFIVQDTGCGMSDKFLEKIFTPFERDSRFGVPDVVGTGLGMAIVKSLVDRLDGTIHISSKVDKGTCVIISLPFARGEKNESVKVREPELKDFAGSTVLVAEDNDINMEIITELLEMNGLKVIAAKNGSEAVALFEASEEGAVDLIIMDMEMPELNGCEAAKAIRGLGRGDSVKVPILALTGNTDINALDAARQAGMDNYLLKPVSMKLLAKKMSEYVQKK